MRCKLRFRSIQPANENKNDKFSRLLQITVKNGFNHRFLAHRRATDAQLSERSKKLSIKIFDRLLKGGGGPIMTYAVEKRGGGGH